MARVSIQRVLTACLLVVVFERCNCGCYYPNGDLSIEADQPCSSESDGACCPLNWQCLSNGLCYLGGLNYYGRYTCTDKTWQSKSCPNICTHDNTASGNEAVLKCNQDSYCCDANRPDVADPSGGLGCCDTLKKASDFFTLLNGKPISSIGDVAAATSTSPSEAATSTSTFDAATQPPATESSSKTLPILTKGSPSSPSPATTSTASSISASGTNGIVSTMTQAGTRVVLITSVVINSAGSLSGIITLTTTAPQSTSNTSNSAPAQTSSSKNLGIKIGVGAGVPIGVIALAALIFFLWRRQKSKKQSKRNLALPADSNQTEFMYKDNVDIGSPYTTTTASPELDSRPLGRYSGMESLPEHMEYRENSIGGLGMHYTPAAEVPNSPSHRISELSSERSLRRQRDSRLSQMSELVGSDSPPHELSAEQASR